MWERPEHGFACPWRRSYSPDTWSSFFQTTSSPSKTTPLGGEQGSRVGRGWKGGSACHCSSVQSDSGCGQSPYISRGVLLSDPLLSVCMPKTSGSSSSSWYLLVMRHFFLLFLSCLKKQRVGEFKRNFQVSPPYLFSESVVNPEQQLHLFLPWLSLPRTFRSPPEPLPPHLPLG